MARQVVKQPLGIPARTRYEDDLYSWVQEQVELLRAGRLGEVDAINIAEELADVGNEQFDKLESAFAVVTQHLLKWDHQPERRSRSWAATVREQRRRIDRVIRKNPGLKPHIAEALREGYADGRDRAIAETEMADETFPVACPYSFEEIMSRDITFEPALVAKS